MEIVKSKLEFYSDIRLHSIHLAQYTLNLQNLKQWTVYELLTLYEYTVY